MEWAGYVARVGNKRIAYRLFVEKSEGKSSLGRLKYKWMDNNKIDLRNINWGGMDWIDLAQDKDQ
jgi:hypothetical protein